MGLEASKKPKADGTQSQSADYSDLLSFHEFSSRYGDSFEDPWNEWEEYLTKLNDKCKIRQIQIYLISKGRVHEAKKIQSFEDKLAWTTKSSHEFRNKGWILRTDPGPYDDYQLLYVGDILEEYSDEELIRIYFSPEGPLFMLYTYADYLEEKMPIAANLGLT